MRVLKIFVVVGVIILFGSMGMAATVTISGTQTTCTGTLILNSMNVDSSGNVTLNVTCSSGTCTPSSAIVGSISPIYITQGSTVSPRVVSITDNCNNPLDYTASLTSGSNFISSVTSNGTGTMTVTFSTSGLSAGTYNGTIRVTPSGYSPRDISVTVTVSTTPPPPPGGAVDITTSGYQPPSTNYVSIQVPGVGFKDYFFKTAKAYSNISVYFEALDGQTDSDLVISTVRQPLCAEIKRGTNSFGTNDLWYKSRISFSGESTTITTPQPAGTTVYVTVCNFTPNSTSRSRLYWNAF